MREKIGRTGEQIGKPRYQNVKEKKERDVPGLGNLHIQGLYIRKLKGQKVPPLDAGKRAEMLIVGIGYNLVSC